MILKNLFSYIITAALFILAAIFNNPLYAYASILSLAVTLFRDIIENKIFTMKDIKLIVPEDIKKNIADLTNRMNTIEYNIKTRGF